MLLAGFVSFPRSLLTGQLGDTRAGATLGSHSPSPRSLGYPVNSGAAQLSWPSQWLPRCASGRGGTVPGLLPVPGCGNCWQWLTAADALLQSVFKTCQRLHCRQPSEMSASLSGFFPWPGRSFLLCSAAPSAPFVVAADFPLCAGGMECTNASRICHLSH